MLVFGRKTYEGMASYWRTAQGTVADLMNSIQKLVFSRTLLQADWANTTLVRDDASGSIRSLKQGGDRPALVFGSADLSSFLANEGLFDEYRLLITPVILGSGKQLFGSRLKPMNLTLVQARSMKCGAVLAQYAPQALGR